MEHFGPGTRRPTLTVLLAAGALATPSIAQAQAVADNALSNVSASQIGSCSEVTIYLNIRVQVLSYFPTDSGQEVHIRVRPLDANALGLARESLRPPTNVPSLRSIEFEGNNPSGPALSLFFTHDMRFEVSAGEDPHTIVIRLAEPGDGAICDTGAGTGRTPPVTPDIAIPEGLYVINLLSRPEDIGPLSSQQKSAIGDHILYETLFSRDAEQWRRLREGFFASRAEAEMERERLAALFPDSFVVKVSADERAQGIVGRISGGTGAATAPQAEASEATPQQAAEAASLVAEAEQAIANGDNDRAIQLLTNVQALPENPSTPRAYELLGLTRERKDQKAQAIAEYEEYLRRYPSGEAADRVRQRLAALGGGGTSAPAELRQASASASDWIWGMRGSFSQFYYRDQSRTKFVDASRPELDPEVDNSVNLNQLLSTGDVTISGGDDVRQVQVRAAGAYAANFREGGRDIKSVTALYADFNDSATGLSARLGRQTRNSSGVLGRFDGLLLGVQASPRIRINAVGGFPVLSSRQTYVLKDRYFYGFSVDVGKKRSPVQTSVYWFDQRARGGFVDRRSVGMETRVLVKRFNAFALVDYDVKFNEMNLALLTLNYSFPDNSNLSVTADYRRSPLLTLSNALIGQVSSDRFEPLLDLRQLREFFTDKEIEQLALDRTLVTKSITASYSRPITQKLQANFDVTVTDTGGTPATPASSGTEAVFALPAAGTEYYYGAQLVGTGLLWDNDIYIISARYADTQRSRIYTADFNARVPLSKSFRLSPRIRYGYRDGKMTPQTPVPGSYRQLQPSLRLNIYPTRRSEMEFEVGANFSQQKDYFGGTPTTVKETGLVFSAGYRLDF